MNDAANETNTSTKNASAELHAGRSALQTLVVFNVVLAVVLGVGLVWGLSRLLSLLPPAGASNAADSLVPALALLAVAGGLGGTLCNLRGISRNLQQEGYFRLTDLVPFYLRPLTGALNGLFTFLLGNLVVAALARPGAAGWNDFNGLLPYVAAALLAGFAVQEFLQKLKDVAVTLFGVKPTTK